MRNGYPHSDELLRGAFAVPLDIPSQRVKKVDVRGTDGNDLNTSSPDRYRAVPSPYAAAAARRTYRCVPRTASGMAHPDNRPPKQLLGPESPRGSGPPRSPVPQRCPDSWVRQGSNGLEPGRGAGSSGMCWGRTCDRAGAGSPNLTAVRHSSAGTGRRTRTVHRHLDQHRGAEDWPGRGGGPRVVQRGAAAVVLAGDMDAVSGSRVRVSADRLWIESMQRDHRGACGATGGA